MLGGRKVRSNKGKKSGSYKTKKTHHSVRVRVSSNGKRRIIRRKVRSNKGKKRNPYGPRTGKTRSGKKFRGKEKKVEINVGGGLLSRLLGKSPNTSPKSPSTSPKYIFESQEARVYKIARGLRQGAFPKWDWCITHDSANTNTQEKCAEMGSEEKKCNANTECKFIKGYPDQS